MKERKSFWAAIYRTSGVALALVGSTAYGDTIPALSTYPVSMEATAPLERVAQRTSPLAQFTIRPSNGVILRGELDPETAMAMGLQPQFALTRGRRLYATPNQPGQFCDLMRNRGLGSLAVCLRDSDGNGTFDVLVEYGGAAVRPFLFITDKQRLREGGYVSSRMLATPVPFDPITDGELPTANVKLWWRNSNVSGFGNNLNSTLSFWLGNNWSSKDGDIVSSRYYSRRVSEFPMSFDVYGSKLTIFGLNKDGSVRYKIDQGSNVESVSFLNRHPTDPVIIPAFVGH